MTPKQPEYRAGDVKLIDGVKHVMQPKRYKDGRVASRLGKPLYEWVVCGSDADRTKPGHKPPISHGGSYMQGLSQ